jgi:hypothetical protein
MDKVILPNLSELRILEDKSSIGIQLESVQGTSPFRTNLGLVPAKQHFSPATKPASIWTMPLKTHGGICSNLAEQRWSEIEET